MKPAKRDRPLYLQFIRTIRDGLSLLDPDIQNEIRQFTDRQQHPSGAFTDRAGNPDCYYSLFGFWLASALNMKSNLERLLAFASVKDIDLEKRPVDRFALMLIRHSLSPGKNNSSKLPGMLFKKEYRVNFSYQLFLSLLVFDARYGRKEWLYFLVRLVLRVYQPEGNVPCSLLAALTVARHEAGLKTEKQHRQLRAFMDGDQGFKSFMHMESGDLLSTGVALYALQTGYDLRLIAPDCFSFVQRQYAGGAFLSGDGDQTRDLEYTFYGLLALGSLAGS
ncbi:hypothetical protein [Gaoshiqia sp. Z1-71]|uniref:hypothetical protein n=1 Tax=Gaoshiqia hydrogeniformans TaxID=3290090 RepID=UPI003BF85B20